MWNISCFQPISYRVKPPYEQSYAHCSEQPSGLLGFSLYDIRSVDPQQLMNIFLACYVTVFRAAYEQPLCTRFVEFRVSRGYPFGFQIAFWLVVRNNTYAHVFCTAYAH